MAGLLPNPDNCCDPCEEPLSVAVPGPQGDPAEPCVPCEDGISAFTTAESFVMPAELANVTVTVLNSEWLTTGQIVWAEGGGAQGNFEVQSKPNTTSVILKNLEDTASGLYLTNSPPATVFPALTMIVASGQQGPAGATPAGALLAANNLVDVANVATSRTNLGLGTAATRTVGVADTNLAPVDDAAGLTNGEMIRATATGVESIAAATARTAIGLGTMATQAASAVAITGGSLIGAVTLTTTDPISAVDLTSTGEQKVSGSLFTAPSAIQSLLAATAINPNRAKIRVIGNGGAVVLVATPTITTPADDGQLLLIMGTSDVNTVTLQDQATLAGTDLELGAATRVLGAGDHILLSYDQTNDLWYEVAFTNN